MGVVAVAAVAGELRPVRAMTATAKSMAAARLRRMRACSDESGQADCECCTPSHLVCPG
jgi:hypothetical protein